MQYSSTALIWGFIPYTKVITYPDSDYAHILTEVHEQGHQKQSLYLGWLYLIFIGLPSLVGNLLFRIKWVKKQFDYYRQPWEWWADRLGGVERD